MKNILAIIIGVILALGVSQLLLHGSVWSLFPWGIVGFGVGYIAKNRKEAIITGAVYGFILSFAFMWLGYKGAASIITRTPFFAALGLFGALCGLILAFVSFFMKSCLIKKG